MIQYLEEMEWRYGSMHPTGWWGRGGSRNLPGSQLDFCLILSHSYLKLQHVWLFSFSLLPCNRQRHRGLVRRTAPCKADLFVLLRDLSAVRAGQCFSFLCSLSVRGQTEINALLAAHCCTKAMIDPSAVTMAIRSPTPASASDCYTTLCCYSLESEIQTSQIPLSIDR